MSDKKDTTFKNSEALFTSTDRELLKEYLEFFDTASQEFLQMYADVELDGTKDALRCRMLAAVRLAQFGLNMFQFFSSCVAVIAEGTADKEACNATTKVVSMMVEKKADEWITKAKQGQN